MLSWPLMAGIVKHVPFNWWRQSPADIITSSMNPSKKSFLIPPLKKKEKRKKKKKLKMFFLALFILHLFLPLPFHCISHSWLILLPPN